MTTKEKIAIVGAGGFGHEVYNLMADCIDGVSYDCIGFIDCEDNLDLPVSVIGQEKDIAQLIIDYKFSNCVLALGNILKRKEVFHILDQYSLIFPKIIGSSVSCYSTDIAEGVVIYPGTVIMNDCKIGRFSLVNSGATLGHDVLIGDFCNINPGVNLAGRITVGDSTFIGIGASVKDNVTIGKNVVIGAGSVVLKNVPDNTKVYGVPAKVSIK
jgi:sugar O-acyltransferase (sialic acid O-acetyltransferase NeuD family)